MNIIYKNASMSEIAIWEQMNDTKWDRRKKNKIVRIVLENLIQWHFLNGKKNVNISHEWYLMINSQTCLVIFSHFLVMFQSFFGHFSLRYQKQSKCLHHNWVGFHLSTINIICSHLCSLNTVRLYSCTVHIIYSDISSFFLFI